MNSLPPTRRRSSWLWAVVAICCLGGTLAVAWMWSKLPTPGVVDRSSNHGENQALASGYVGSEACGACHRDEWESYRQHPMYVSTRTISAGEFADLQAATSKHERPRVNGKQRFFEVAFDGQTMAHIEKMTDASGATIFEQSVSMDYVVGSGRRAKAFVYHRGSKLLMSPLNLYSNGGVWDVAPGYAADDPRRFDRRVNDECVMCHTGRAARLGHAPDLFAKPAFHEAAIGCETCHGPGEKHRAAHQAGTSLSSERDPIVSPARLDYERRESICQQCHLQAAARVLRAGRSPFDFQPGELFEETWTVLDAGAGVDADGQTRAVNHVPQMQSSRCFKASDPKLGCTSCHDPHRVPQIAERATYYRARCLKCHDTTACTAEQADRQAKDDSCIACHMPARESNNVSHVTQTDHRIIRRPSSRKADESAEPPDQLTFFGGADQRLTPLERDRAMGLGAWIHLSKKSRRPDRSLAKFMDGVLNQSPDDGSLLAVLGSMAQEGRRPELAINYYGRARRFPATAEMALNGLVTLYSEARRWDEALDCADRLLLLDPGHARVSALKAEILLALGRREEAVTAAENALKFDPTLTDVRRGLVRLYGELGKLDRQREQQEILQRIEAASR